MTRERPTLFRQPHSAWWYASWYTEAGRVRFSLKKYGISIEKFPRIEDATDAFLRFIGELPGEPEPGAETVEWGVERFIGAKTPHIRPSTLKEYRVALGHFERFWGGKRALAAVKRLDVVEFQRRLLTAGEKPPTVNKICRHVRHFFGWLVEMDVLAKNPFSNFPAIDEHTDEKKHLTPSELRHFLETVWTDRPRITSTRPAELYDGMKRLVMICVATGLRRKEIMLIERADVDLTNSRVRVMNIKHKKQPKRWITIPSLIRQDFQWFIETSVGTLPFFICHPDTLTHRVKFWLRKAGLPESLHLHSLRHTFATLALQAGESSWRLKDHLAHSSIALLETTYAHTDVDDGKEISLGIDLTRPETPEQI